VTAQLTRSLDDRDVVRDVAISADGQRAASASRFGTVNVWDLESRLMPAVPDTEIGDAVNDIAILFARRQAICATTHTLLVVDLETAKPLQTFDTTQLQITCTAASADGRWAASGSWEDSVKVWDLASGQLVHTLEGHAGWINGVAFTPDSRRIVSVSKDGARVWDVEGGALVGFLKSRFGIDAVAVAPDGNLVVTGSSEGAIVWDLETGQPLRTLKADWVRALAIDPRGLVVVSGSDKSLKAWEIETGRLLRTFDADRSKVADVAFSPDGTLMIAASNKTISVWNARTGEVVSAFTCDGSALCCAFVDNRRVLLGDLTGNLHALSLEYPDSE
jgi:WD40 repeat protein